MGLTFKSQKELERFVELRRYWEEKKEIVEKFLKDYLDNKEPQLLFEAMRYSLFAGGKRLRPLLVFLGYEVCGGERVDEVVPIGAAFELVHTFSLIHDDLPAMDDDDYRRGRPANHKVFGEGIAILAGDALFSMAFEVLFEAPIEKKRLLQIVKLLSVASGARGMIGGQVCDLQAEGAVPDEQMVRKIHRMKTGELIKAALVSGGIAAGADERKLTALRKAGLKLGISFQIVDDILDEIGESEKMGKAVRKDRERGKCTYPRVFGIERAKKDAQDLIEEVKYIINENFGRKGKLLSDLAQFIVERSY